MIKSTVVKLFTIGITLLATGAIYLLGCDRDNKSTNSSEPTFQLPPKMVDDDGVLICDRDFGDPRLSLFILPYQVGKRSTLIQSYCDPNNSHHDRFAIDFGPRFRDTILAARSGVVYQLYEQYNDNDYTYGHHNYVMILHADGTLAFYAHLLRNSVAFEVGDTVHQGEPLAQCGSSGMPYYLPCLHFEVLYDTLEWEFSNSVPVNFRNANGPLNENRAVMDDSTYVAGTFVPNDL